jgi:glycosyltransferase involved in cell wall biosynthesis
MGHQVTVYTYNGSKMTQKYWDTKNLKVVSIGVIATMTIKAGLIYEDSGAWNEGIWSELEHEDTTNVLLVFDWFGFDAAVKHRTAYGSKVVGVVGALANGRGGFVPFTDAAKLADFKEKELEFLKHSDNLITFNFCSYQEVSKLTDVPAGVVTLGVNPIDFSQQKAADGRVLVVGRISREKCLEIILRAMTQKYWVELVLCGTGKDTDYGRYISKQAEKLEVSNRLTFKEAQPDYNSAEIVICPSVYDPFSYQIYDAFNYGVPVIGHYMSYMDSIRSGDNGFTYQSVAELSTALDRLHHSKPLRNQLALTAKGDCMELYTQQKSLERMETYLMALGGGPN